MVAASALPTGLLPPQTRAPIVDDKGVLVPSALQLLQGYFKLINGLNPTVPCNGVFNSNLYTLTPFNISPQVLKYTSYWSFAFVAPAPSTGLVTATVVPTTGSLAALKVFKTNGSAQATTGDITINLFYLLYFVDTLDSGNGGFVLK